MKHRTKRQRAAALLALIMAMTLLLSACGGDEDVSGQISSSGDNETPSVGGSVTGNEDDTSEPEPEPTPSDTPLSIGRLQGGVYTNEYIGIACELDSTWEFYTAEELNENMGLTSELFEGTELEEAAADVEQFFDMQAESAEALTGVNILYEKLDMQQRLAYATLSEEEIVDATLEMSDTLIQTYAQAGIDVSEMSKKTVSFLGEERTAIWTSAQIQGVGYYTLQLFYYHLGQYAATITFYSYVDDNTQSLLDLFYAA